MLGEQEPAGRSGCLNKRVFGAVWRYGISRRDRKAHGGTLYSLENWRRCREGSLEQGRYRTGPL